MHDLAHRLLIRDEGFRRSAYTDHLGYWTIGVGRLIDARKGGGITQEEALYLLEHDIQRCADQLDARIPWWRGLNEVRQAVLLSMTFQLGIAGLMLFRDTLAAAQAGRFSDAANEMLRSRWASQTPLRAYRLAHAMRTGESSAFDLDEDPS